MSLKSFFTIGCTCAVATFLAVMGVAGLTETPAKEVAAEVLSPVLPEPGPDPRVAAPASSDFMKEFAVYADSDASRFESEIPDERLECLYPWEEDRPQLYQVALRRALPHSINYCWRYVKQALLEGGYLHFYPQSGHAKEAAEIFRRIGFDELPIHDPYAAPKNAIIVYGGEGSGHIEIRTPFGFVSDFATPNRSPRPVIGIFMPPERGFTCEKSRFTTNLASIK